MLRWKEEQNYKVNCKNFDFVEMRNNVFAFSVSYLKIREIIKKDKIIMESIEKKTEEISSLQTIMMTLRNSQIY